MAMIDLNDPKNGVSFKNGRKSAIQEDVDIVSTRVKKSLD
jgi:hypothetical protein